MIEVLYLPSRIYTLPLHLEILDIYVHASKHCNPLFSLCQTLGVPMDRLVRAVDSVSVCSNFQCTTCSATLACEWATLLGVPLLSYISRGRDTFGFCSYSCWDEGMAVCVRRVRGG